MSSLEETKDKLIRIQRKENLQNEDKRVRKQKDDTEMSKYRELEVADFYM